MTTYTVPETQHNYVYELNQHSVRSFIHYDACDRYYIVVSEKETESEEHDEFYFRSRNKTSIVHYLGSLYNESEIVGLQLYDYDTLPSETSFDFLNNWSRVPLDVEVMQSIYTIEDFITCKNRTLQRSDNLFVKCSLKGAFHEVLMPSERLAYISNGPPSLRVGGDHSRVLQVIKSSPVYISDGAMVLSLLKYLSNLQNSQY